MELEGAGDDTLRAAGICSGDTLWLMTPFDQKKSDASSTESVEPATANSFSTDPVGALQTHEPIAAPSEASAQLPTVHDCPDVTVQHPTQVSCSNNTAMQSNFAARLQKRPTF